MRWWWRSRQRQRRAGVRNMVDVTEAQAALERARAARDDAAGHLAEVRLTGREIRAERVRNHLARDVYEAMRHR